MSPRRQLAPHLRVTLLMTVLVAAALADASAIGRAAPAIQRPNILLIYADDQGAWTLGAEGNRQAHTPVIDRLAREGARFLNAFTTTPVCSPARASMLTSRYGSELGILDFITPTTHKEYVPGRSDHGLEERFPTFPAALAQAGYATALFGKWHLGDWRTPTGAKYHPTRHGFTHFFGFIGGGAGPTDPEIEVAGVPTRFKGLTDDILTDAAIAYMKENRAKPFYVQLALRSPHSPWLPAAPEDMAPYEKMEPDLPHPDYPDLDAVKARRMMREYLTSVSGVDRNVGRLLAVLQQLGLAENTIVIYSSDNGYNLAHNGIWHKGNGYWLTKSLPTGGPNIPGKFRPNMYDNSLRVPLVIVWPGVVRPGLEISHTVSGLDWYPTVLAMAGVSVPENTFVRGRNFLPLLRGEKPAAWDNDLYAEYSMRVYARTDLRTYRTPRWKLTVDFLNPGRDELYDLVGDPAETRNLVDDPGVEAQAARLQLAQKIRDAMLANHDPIANRSSAP